jgi:tetraprenyl-beta-curcumene synthase
MFATLAPPRYRRPAAEASIAVEVIYNYLDALTEQPIADPLAAGQSLFGALTEPFATNPALSAAYYAGCDSDDDGGYLAELVAAARAALALLPATPRVAEVAHRTADRCGEAQTRMHAARFIGDDQLRAWASREAQGTGLRWQELVAGAAASGVTLHALIAAAADSATTEEEAVAVGAIYFPVSAVSMILDSVVDYDRDLRRTGTAGFIRLCPDHDALATRCVWLARRAMRRARNIRDGPHHLARFVAIVAYYTSDQGARDAVARPIIAPLCREVGPLIWLTLPVLRIWRLARRVRWLGEVVRPRGAF